MNDHRSHRHEDPHDDNSYRDAYEQFVVKKTIAFFLEREPWLWRQRLRF